jgi:hypothetical protein
MTLYTLNGQYPTNLPFRIRLADGRTRTDSSTFTPEEILDAGFTEVSDKPVANNTQTIEWSSEQRNWILLDKTEEEILNIEENKNFFIKTSINNHRNILIWEGFIFNGVKYDSRPEDQKRISGAGLLAFMAISQGSQIGDYYWHGGSTPFAWISQDNSINLMDAMTVIQFGKKAAEHESAHIFAARMLKDMNPIPEDFTNIAYWPQVETT